MGINGFMLFEILINRNLKPTNNTTEAVPLMCYTIQMLDIKQHTATFFMRSVAYTCICNSSYTEVILFYYHAG